MHCSQDIVWVFNFFVKLIVYICVKIYKKLFQKKYIFTYWKEIFNEHSYYHSNRCLTHTHTHTHTHANTYISKRLLNVFYINIFNQLFLWCVNKKKEKISYQKIIFLFSSFLFFTNYWIIFILITINNSSNYVIANTL